MSELHTLGFVVHRQLFQVDKRAVGQLLDECANPQLRRTWLGNRIVDDVLQVDAGAARFAFWPTSESSLAALTAALARVTDLTQSGWQVIGSQAGCAEQAPHTDYMPCLSGIGRELEDQDFPGVAIAAVMPSTRLCVWPRSIRLLHHPEWAREPIAKQTLELEPGDVLQFRGDLVHAGAAYETDHLRLHCWLDSERCTRGSRGNYWIARADDARLRAAILP